MTATVSGTPHVFTTAVTGPNSQATNGFFASFAGATVGTITGPVTFVRSPIPSLMVVYYLCFYYFCGRDYLYHIGLLLRRRVGPSSFRLFTGSVTFASAQVLSTFTDTINPTVTIGPTSTSTFTNTFTEIDTFFSVVTPPAGTSFFLSN